MDNRVTHPTGTISFDANNQSQEMLLYVKRVRALRMPYLHATTRSLQKHLDKTAPIVIEPYDLICYFSFTRVILFPYAALTAAPTFALSSALSSRPR